MMTKFQFNDGLARRGYRMLGSGMYSTVWGKPSSSRVIKVGSITDSWLSYIVWAMEKGYTGTKAPRVYSFKVNENYFVAVMERLYKLNDENRTLMYNMIYGRSFGEDKDIPAEWKNFAADFKAQFQGRHDMHEDNLMQRNDGTLVLTDPISTGGSETPNRYKSRPSQTVNSLRDDKSLVWC